jgi:prepilin-type N-terminal cleavage/methylation domain-containing protein
MGANMLRLMLMPKGFTLIEILVSIAILAILGIASVPALRNFNETQNLNNAASDLGYALRTAQNNAQTGARCKNGLTAVEDSADALTNGTWKVTISSTGFTLKASNCQDLTLSPPGAAIADPYPEAHLFSEYSPGISRSSITNCSTSNDKVVFAPSSNSLSTTCSIVLVDSRLNSNQYKSICINQGGAITIKDGNSTC